MTRRLSHELIPLAKQERVVPDEQACSPLPRDGCERRLNIAFDPCVDDMDLHSERDCARLYVPCIG